MRLLGFGGALFWLGASVPALAQVPAVPAPASTPAPAPAQEPPPPEPPAPEPPPPEPAPQSAQTDPASGEAAPEPPAPVAPAQPAPAPRQVEQNDVVLEAQDETKDEPKLAPFERARSPLTLDARLGFSWRPEGDSGFDAEDTLGSELGLSMYFELKREIAAGIEIERTSLGRGTAITGLDSVSVDYTATSALLGFRAYPLRRELLDVFVGFQVGAGVQGVSAAGTHDEGGVLPASVYECGGSDQPALVIGGGIGARFMLTERWGVTARVNGTGRRLSGEFVDDCARGIGTTTSVSGSLGVGYDFEME